MAKGTRGQSTGYSAIHLYLRRHFPKRGICDECGRTRRTDYALIRGRKYSRNREDYRELCRQCHNAYDEIAARQRSRAVARRGDAPLCACGCGTPVNWNGSSWSTYRRGHAPAPTKPLELLTMACERCGGEFQATRRDARFCSNACKVGHRRDVHLDHVERACHQCGGTFTTNRFHAAVHCSKSCAMRCRHAGNCPEVKAA